MSCWDVTQVCHKQSLILILSCGRVVRCRTCDRDVVGSNPTRGCCVPTSTQRAIPPKRTYHAMHWSRIHSHVASAGVWLRATGNGDQCHPKGP